MFEEGIEDEYFEIGKSSYISNFSSINQEYYLAF